MRYTMYQIDAFTNHLFGGNPAAVVPLQAWLPDATMLSLAEENNLAETVFFVPSTNADADFDIRWFTPGGEINLCGHATLASAHVLFNELNWQKPSIRFSSMSGLLICKKNENAIKMDFPSWVPQPTTEHQAALMKALGLDHIESLHKYRDWIVVLKDEAAVRNCIPDFTVLKSLPMVMITAPGDEVDFVSRFFAPGTGVDEDPVTGSAHSQLIPFWAARLGKTEMQARQLSKRIGDIKCSLQGDRVTMEGETVFYMKGEFVIG
jgi:PhzF family phenazine biosynthesis protein